jgi:hypothetical protein
MAPRKRKITQKITPADSAEINVVQGEIDPNTTGNSLNPSVVASVSYDFIAQAANDFNKLSSPSQKGPLKGKDSEAPLDAAGATPPTLDAAGIVLVGDEAPLDAAGATPPTQDTAGAVLEGDGAPLGTTLSTQDAAGATPTSQRTRRSTRRSQATKEPSFSTQDATGATSTPQDAAGAVLEGDGAPQDPAGALQEGDEAPLDAAGAVLEGDGAPQDPAGALQEGDEAPLDAAGAVLEGDGAPQDPAGALQEGDEAPLDVEGATPPPQDTARALNRKPRRSTKTSQANKEPCA